MFHGRVFYSLLIVLGAAGSARAQAYNLAEAPLEGAFFRIELSMALAGELHMRQDDKVITLKQSATAKYDFLERVLDVKDNVANRTARYYKSARAEIKVDSDVSVRTFRPDQCVMIAQRRQDRPLVFAKAPLSREELELTEHFDTLVLPGLLPGKKVALGATWKVPNLVAQVLCDLDGLTAQDLTCTLTKVENDVASVSVSGSVSGIDMGALVKVMVQASSSYRFDLKAQRIVAVDWKQSDQREPGRVSPGMSADVAYQLQRTPLEEEVKELHDFALVWAPRKAELPESLTQVEYKDPAARYEIVHHRDWHMCACTPEYMVLRLLDTGMLVAQATVMPWKKAPPGKTMTKQQFKEAVDASPGWNPEETLDEGSEVTGNPGYTIYRNGALGALDGHKVIQYSYLVADAQGQQLVVTFTMLPDQSKQLDTRDIGLVRGITLPVLTSQVDPPAKEETPKEQPQP